MAKIYSPRKFSYMMAYSDEDIATLLGISRKTVVGWRKLGLKPIDNHQPILYHGHNIQEVLGKNKR